MSSFFEEKRVVVTGLGMINALGLDKESAFSAIVEGKCGIKNIELFDTENKSLKICRAGHTPLSVITDGVIQDFIPDGIGIGFGFNAGDGHVGCRLWIRHCSLVASI